MKKKLSRVLATIMCVMTAVAFMPAMAFAAEDEVQEETLQTTEQVQSAEQAKDVEQTQVQVQEAKTEPKVGDISVRVSISDQGNMVVKAETITVTDINANGKFDIDDALVATHNEKYSGKAAAGYKSESSDYGLSLKKLWGETYDGKDPFGYWYNNTGEWQSAWSLEDEIVEGGSVYAFVYKDQSGWSDSFSFFNSESETLYVGERATLNLKAAGYDEDWKTVFNNCADATIKINGEDTENKTNSEGNVELSFSEDGTYFVTAHKADGSIVPAYCTIKVRSRQGMKNNSNLGDSKKEYIDRLSAINIKQYRTSEQIQVIKEIVKGVAAINSVDTIDAAKTEYCNAAEIIASIKTDAQMTAEEKAVAATGIGSFSVSRAKKKATVRWAASSTFDGYQIYYKQAKKGAKYTSTRGSSLTIKKLKSKKKYTFKVRGYKRMNGKTIYGKWSTARTVKIK